MTLLPGLHCSLVVPGSPCISVSGLTLGDPVLLAEAARIARCMLLLGIVKGVA